MEEVEGWLAAQGWHVAAAEHPGFDPAAILAATAPAMTAAARMQAAACLARMAADAVLLPLPALLRARGAADGAAGPRAGALADPLRLAGMLGQPPAAVLRRLALLPASLGVVAGLATCDASGALTFRRPVAGFPMPRFASACALWPLYEALMRPLVPVVADLAVAGPVPLRFRAYAVAEPRWPQGYDREAVTEATMLVLPATGPATGQERVVGATCRTCTRPACPARREPALGGAGV
jgi:hypothetical protein